MRRLFILFMSMISLSLHAQEPVELYDILPNTKQMANIKNNHPELYIYSPKHLTHNKVFLILPGGGYTHLALDHEGHDVAKRLADLGYYAFVLKYRLPTSRQQIDKKIAPIQDAQKAFVYMKERVASLTNQKMYYGVIGFSAGGHLASTLSTHFYTDYLDANLHKDKLRPDFSVLVYPVISLQKEITHNGSKQALIGSDCLDSDVLSFSNEKKVNEETPPAFLVHAKDDKAVPIENSLLYQRELNKFYRDNFLFEYEQGGHGFGMINKYDSRDWFMASLEWLEQLKLL